MLEYKIIGRSFRLGREVTRGDFVGPVVASSEAFFLCIDRTPGVGYGAVIGAALAGPVGLLAGTAVGWALSGGVDKRHDVRQCDYAELPEEITRHPDWPLKRRRSGVVVVIPREAVDKIRSAFFGTYDLHCGRRVYCIGLSQFGRFGALRFLKEAGWDSKLSKSPPLLVQLAPLWCMALGGAIGAGFNALLELQFPGSTPMLIGGGILFGLLMGYAVTAGMQRP